MIRVAAFFVSLVALAGAAQAPGQLPLQPVKDAGQSVTGAFEGWYQNPDGTFILLVGYFNRNQVQTFDIPVGPANHLDPGGPDQGQPTYFLPRRQWGVFTITVPKDFGDKKLTWTIVANNQTTVIPLSLNPLWNIEPFRHAMGNTPPKLTFESGGRVQQGPPRGISASYTTKAGEPLALAAWATDDGLTSEGQPVGAGRAGAAAARGRGGDAPAGAGARGRGGDAAAGAGGRGGRGSAALATLTWSKFRGPGLVTFDKIKPELEGQDGKATTTATFSAPGDYILRLQANDASGEGGGGFQCCWTNAHVKVTVTAVSSAKPLP